MHCGVLGARARQFEARAPKLRGHLNFPGGSLYFVKSREFSRDVTRDFGRSTNQRSSYAEPAKKFPAARPITEGVASRERPSRRREPLGDLTERDTRAARQ